MKNWPALACVVGEHVPDPGRWVFCRPAGLYGPEGDGAPSTANPCIECGVLIPRGSYSRNQPGA